MDDRDNLLQRLATRHAIPFARHALAASGHFSPADGLTLHYRDWGGSGPAVILLHGGMLAAPTWDLVCLELGDGFRRVALDLRGHGLSGWSEDYTIRASVSDVDALMRHLRLEDSHLVGMSLGGNVAAHVAVTHPGRASSLVMVDVGPGADFGSAAGMRAFIERPIGGLSVDRLADEARRLSPASDRDKLLFRYGYMTRVLPDGTLAWRHDRERPEDFLHILETIEELATLAPEITCPALIVRGERSRVLTDEKAERFARMFPDGRWTVVPHAGHNVQEDNPKALAAVIRTFLAGPPADHQACGGYR
ncbi:MAG: alpha/beta hydrolase [Xanthobacteraceae bacterium]